MKIADLLQHIRSLIDKYESNQFRNFQAILDNLRLILEDCQDGRNLSKYEEAVRFIETINIKSFIGGRILFGNLLAKDNYPTLLTNEELNNYSNTAFFLAPSGKGYDQFRQELGNIHVTLQKSANELKEGFATEQSLKRWHRTELAKPSFGKTNSLPWVYIYPLDGDQIINPRPLLEWQEDRKILSHEDAAFVDFLRFYEIDGVTARSKIEIIDNIKKLVAKAQMTAKNYAEKHPGTHVYTEEELAKLERWIRNNGSQHNNRFVDRLLSAGLFAEESPIPYIIGKSIPIKNNLIVTEEGKIRFEYEVAILSLTDCVKKWVIIDPLSQSPKKDPGKVLIDDELMDPRYTKILENLQDLNPVLWVKGQFDLDFTWDPVEGEQVLPKLTFLKMEGYTHELKHPGLMKQQPNAVIEREKPPHLALKK